VSDNVRSAWYKAVRDIVPTTERASKINLQPTDTGRKGKSTDTRSQRLAIRDAAQNFWRWTRNTRNSTGSTGGKHDTGVDTAIPNPLGTLNIPSPLCRLQTI